MHHELEFDLGDGVVLRPVVSADAEELSELIDADRDHLAPWMPWAEGQRLETTREFIARAEHQLGRGDGFQLVIAVKHEIVGTIGFHAVDRVNRSTSIGYWIAAEHQGRGIVTAAVRTLIDYAFSFWGLHRVEIRTAVNNDRSRAVCERLGLASEGVLRQAERIGDRYNDLVVYSVLEDEWGRRAADAQSA